MRTDGDELLKALAAIQWTVEEVQVFAVRLETDGKEKLLVTQAQRDEVLNRIAHIRTKWESLETMLTALLTDK